MTKFISARYKKITKEQSRDTGMAMVLLVLILFAAKKREWMLIGAMALHVVNMIVPQIYRPVALLWLGFSEVLSTVTSKILLSIVFFGVVTPIGVVRRLFGKDAMKLHAFKAGQDSTMLERNHKFTARDLERPY